MGWRLEPGVATVGWKSRQGGEWSLPVLEQEPWLQVSPEWAGVQGGMPEMACCVKTNEESLVQGVRDDKRASVPERLESHQAIVRAASLKAEAAAQVAEGSAECLIRT